MNDLNFKIKSQKEMVSSSKLKLDDFDQEIYRTTRGLQTMLQDSTVECSIVVRLYDVLISLYKRQVRQFSYTIDQEDLCNLSLEKKIRFLEYENAKLRLLNSNIIVRFSAAFCVIGVAVFCVCIYFLNY